MFNDTIFYQETGFQAFGRSESASENLLVTSSRSSGGIYSEKCLPTASDGEMPKTRSLTGLTKVKKTAEIC